MAQSAFSQDANLPSASGKPTTPPTPLEYRAPSGHAEALIEPSLAQVLRQRTTLASTPVALQQQLERVVFCGVPLPKLRAAARTEAWRAAVSYTASYRPLWFDQNAQQAYEQLPQATWLVAGHQPELFHSGVWFKNFLLSQAGSDRSVVPLNLVIDNDLCRSSAIRVLCSQPGEFGTQLRTESVPFDGPATAIAWECRSIIHYDWLESFPQRAREASLGVTSEPWLLDQLWPHVLAAARRTGNLGLALAQGRHALEGELGLKTLELPLSHLVSQSSFAHFSLALLGDMARFQEVYNRQRALYRQRNQIRSQSHPVPELTNRHGWYEAPWWVYRQTEPTRRRLFVQRQGSDMCLSDGAGWQTTIEGPLDSRDAISDWQQCAIDGILLRPRALMTTLFARLLISDLFLHGIGGGKYDQLTDAIITDYFNITPPTMIVATATMHLPLGNQSPSQTPQENRQATEHAHATAWQLRYHPEQHLNAGDVHDEETLQLLQTKQELLSHIPPRGEKWQWHRQITSVNRRLAELNAQAWQRAQARMQELALNARQLKLAYSREFSFCLFPPKYLVDSLKRLANAEFDRAPAK